MLRSDLRRSVTNNWPLLLILFFVLLTRLACLEEYISGYDPGNYWLALDDYSIVKERPHPPGYPVYVGLLHGVVAITGDRHDAMLLVQLIFSLAGVMSLYFLAMRWMGRKGAVLAASLLAVNPLFWLYGATSENYSWDAFFGTTAVLSLLAARGSLGMLGVGALLGIGAGFRGASLVLMAPVLLYLAFSRLRAHTIRLVDIATMTAGIIAGLLLWLPATAAKVGGLEALLRDSTGVTTASAGPFLGNLVGMVITLFWTLNLTGLYLLMRSGRLFTRLRQPVDLPSVPVLLLLWVVPQVVFFALVIYTKGYALLTLPAVCIGTAWLVMREEGMVRRGAIAGMLLLAHALVFLAIPYTSPPAFTTLAPRNRTTGQRLQSAMGRAVSVYLPSVWRIRASDAQVSEALRLVGDAVDSGEDTTSVVLDPSVGLFAGPRTMQVYMPRTTFVSPGIRAVRLVAYHRGIDKVERYGDTASLSAPRLLLLTDRGLAERYGDLGVVLSSGSFYALVEIPSMKHRELRGRLEDLFVRWE